MGRNSAALNYRKVRFTKLENESSDVKHVTEHRLYIKITKKHTQNKPLPHYTMNSLNFTVDNNCETHDSFPIHQYTQKVTKISVNLQAVPLLSYSADDSVLLAFSMNVYKNTSSWLNILHYWTQLETT